VAARYTHGARGETGPPWRVVTTPATNGAPAAGSSAVDPGTTRRRTMHSAVVVIVRVSDFSVPQGEDTPHLVLGRPAQGG
jgi:hypothetical protein